MKYAQQVEVLEDGSRIIQYDWYPGSLPSNLQADDMVYFDTSYSFTSFNSIQPVGLKLGYASGNYGLSIISTGERAVINIGKFVILGATGLISNDSITIGDHCMFSWGSVITDSWLNLDTFPTSVRRKMLEDLSTSQNRNLEFKITSPVIIEENVWVGFGAVILPGVTLGRGCVVGCKTIITEDVPPYAVVVGQPPRIVKYLEPDDTEEAKTKALKEYRQVNSKISKNK